MLRRPLVAPLLVSALAVGACGGTHEADRQDVSKAVKGFYNGIAQKDAKKVCGSISKKGKQEIEKATAQRAGKKQTCEAVINLALAVGSGGLDEAKNVDVTDVKIDGDQARATVSLQSRKSQVGLVKEDGAWKLSGADIAGG